MSAILSNRSMSPFGRSNLTEQLEGETTPRKSSLTRIGSPKPRSFSEAAKPSLSPSPAFREPQQFRMSKDDHDVSPTTPRRHNAHARGLSLQMPSKESNAAQIAKIPLSPKLETSNIYGSPSSMLPRHSRGLDFTRACTNLHHSTLADSTPEASPITGKGIQIPSRRSLGTDSPSTSSALWTSLPQEKTTLSSSVSSINMLESDSDSDSSDDMALDQDDDPIMNTPAATRPAGYMHSPGNEWMHSPGPTGVRNFHNNVMNYRRSRLRKPKSKAGSNSVNMRHLKPSPGPISPPIMKSVENEGYFGLARQLKSRRESLSLGTDDLHLSDSEGEKTNSSTMESGSEGPRGVIRRAVTRRSNLLPKTKGFARIKAALLEESAPVDSEQRKEAEIMKQIETDTDFRRPSQISPPANPVESVEDSQPNEENSLPVDNFGQHAKRNSAGLGFWNAFDSRYRTPPPALFPRESSSGISDETMDTISDNPNLQHLHRSRSRSTTPLASNGPSAEEVARKANKKRRRDDDLDPASFKRRAVSPGMSVQSSPVLPQSPVSNGNKDWGRPPPKTTPNERSNSGGSVSSSVKRVGLQGMSEAHESFMSMSID